MGTLLSIDQTADLFRTPTRIFVAAHIMPDGDCLGSALGLTWALRKIGKTVNVTCNDHVPHSFAFLPGFGELAARVPSDEELLVFVDGSSSDRFGPAYDPKFFDGRTVVAIDHHVTNELFAPLNFVDTHAAATAEIIFRLLDLLSIPVDATIAQCLLTGVITDTLGFRTGNTTVDSLQTAAALVKAGAEIPDIVERSFNQLPLPNLRLRGKVFSSATLDGLVLWAEIPLKLLRELGVNGNGASGIINQLLSVDTAQIAAIFTEKDNGKIDVGLRSRVGYDVSAIAARLGGGGHVQAAGALLDGPLEAARDRVLAEIKKSLAG